MFICLVMVILGDYVSNDNIIVWIRFLSNYIFNEPSFVFSQFY